MGLGAAVAVGTVAAVMPLPARAEELLEPAGFNDHSRRRSRDRHSRRRSYDDSHSRRRSRNAHSRRRSRGHGRVRSRREFRDWNEECYPTPFGWFCIR
jgi:hypothetical protein